MQFSLTSRPPHFWGFCLLHSWVIKVYVCIQKVVRNVCSGMFLGKCIIPMMRIFRHQSRVIQCMLIIMNPSVSRLVQKLVIKAMSVSVAISRVSHLMSTYNARLCSSTISVMFCFDVLCHLGSYCLMNFTNPTWVPICKGKFSIVHRHAEFAMHLFSFLHSYAQILLQLSNVLCP